MEIEIKKLKLTLLKIYEEYLKDPSNEDLKKEAAIFYKKYMNVDPMLDRKTTHALICLVDIGYDTGLTVSEEKAKKIINNLKETIKNEKS